MANWWDRMIGGMVNREQDWAGQRYGVGGTGDRRATAGQRLAAQTGAGAAAPSPISMATLVPENLEQAGRMGGAYGGGLLGLTAPAPDPLTYAGMTQEELLAYLLGGGGGVDLSGYNTMLDDISSRETALGQRKAEQEAFLASLYDAAEARATADRDALAAAVEAQLASDAERRAAEMELVREGDVNRAAAATAAREALGAPTGPDLTSAAVENVASGVAAGGAVADRDARIREGIARQQLTREIAGLTPMEQMATMQLGNMYEDRLAALASERAAIQAQMAQARSAYSGPSPSEKMAALQFSQDVFTPQQAEIALPDLLQEVQGIKSYFGPDTSEVLGVANRILSETDVSRIDPSGEMSAQEALTRLRSSDPAVADLLLQYPEAAGIIVNYVVQANKG